MSQSRVEVSVAALRHNLSRIRQRLDSRVAVMPVLKANAYGHGLEQLVPTLLAEGIDRFAVAHLEEALTLRALAPGCPILVFEGCPDGLEPVFREQDLTASWFDPRPIPDGLKVELKVDTGMARLGLPWERVGPFLESSRLHPQGIFSHFARADTDEAFTRLQLRRFLEATGGVDCPRHICNSAGLAVPQAHLEQVRPGLALYGIRPRPGFEDLKPVLTWKAGLLSVRPLKAGEWLSYGTTFQAGRDSRIGIVGVGYADGYRRSFSNRSRVQVGDRLAPVVGRVTMDLTCIDLTDLEGVEAGDEVTLLSCDPASPLSCEELARLADTIPYEILTGIGARVHRTLVD